MILFDVVVYCYGYERSDVEIVEVFVVVGFGKVFVYGVFEDVVLFGVYLYWEEVVGKFVC